MLKRIVRRLVTSTVLMVLIVASVANAQPLRITFHTWPIGHQYGDGMKVLIDEFNAMQSEIYVEQIPTAGAVDTFLVMHAGGITPDIAWHHLTGIYAASGGVIPLDRFLEYSGFDDMIEEMAEAHRVNGIQYGIPYGSLAEGIVMYSRDMLQQAAVPEPQEGWTWSDLFDMARLLTRVDGDGQTRTYGYDNAPDWYYHIWMATNDTWFWDGERYFPHPDRTVEAMTAMLDLPIRGYSPYGTLGGANKLDLFRNQRSAMFNASLRNVEDLRKAPVPWDVGAIHFPIGRSRGVVISTRAIHLGNTRDPVRQEAAWKFVQWALQPEQQVKFFLAGSLAPTTLSGMRQAIQEVAHTDPLIVPFLEEMSLYGKVNPHGLPHWPDATRIMDGLRRAIMQGEISPQEAVTQLSERLNALIDR